MPALPLDQVTLDKAFYLYRPQFSHLYLRALNEMIVSSSSFTVIVQCKVRELGL